MRSISQRILALMLLGVFLVSSASAGIVENASPEITSAADENEAPWVIGQLIKLDDSGTFAFILKFLTEDEVETIAAADLTKASSVEVNTTDTVPVQNEIVAVGLETATADEVNTTDTATAPVQNEIVAEDLETVTPAPTNEKFVVQAVEEDEAVTADETVAAEPVVETVNAAKQEEPPLPPYHAAPKVKSSSPVVVKNNTAMIGSVGHSDEKSEAQLEVERNAAIAKAIADAQFSSPSPKHDHKQVKVLGNQGNVSKETVNNAAILAAQGGAGANNAPQNEPFVIGHNPEQTTKDVVTAASAVSSEFTDTQVVTPNPIGGGSSAAQTTANNIMNGIF